MGLQTILSKFGAKISTASSEQSIRGIRMEHIDQITIICGGSTSTKTKEGRDRHMNGLGRDITLRRQKY